jgi:Rieske Fe-S protein
VLKGAAVSGVAATALGTSACASPSSGAGVPTTAGATVPTSQVPVGGGVVLQSGGGIVVVQPAAGTFAAYSAVCPHQGCIVGQIQEGLIVCPCHGSTFRVSDGAVVQGPAQQGLTKLPSHVSGADVVVT